MFGFLLEFIIVDSKSILLTNKNPNNHPSSNNRDSRPEPFAHMKPNKNPNNSPSRNNRESRPRPGACWVLVRCYRVGDCDCYTFSYKHPIKTCMGGARTTQRAVAAMVDGTWGRESASTAGSISQCRCQEQATPDKSKLTVLPILSNGTPPMLEPSPPMLAPPMLLGLAFDFCLGAAEY